MSIEIPSKETRILKQSNRSDSLGSIVESFNLDLTSNLGSIRTTRSKIVKKSDDKTQIGDFGRLTQGVCGIEDNNGAIQILSGQQVWNGGNSPFDSYTIDTIGSTPNDVQSNRSDSSMFNGAYWVGSLNNISKL